MFEATDKDNSGSIDINEFLLLYGIIFGIASNKQWNSLLTQITGGTMDQKLEMSFKLYDADGSGYLTPEEIERMFMLAIKTGTRYSSQIN